MKFKHNILLRPALVTGAWAICIYKIYIDFDHHYLLDDLIHIVFISSASLISITFIYFDYRRYQQQKKPLAFISIAATVICVAILFITINQLRQQDRTQSILYASRLYNGLNSISVDLRENGTYKCGKRHFFSSYYIRGHYEIHDSIIYLDRQNLHNLLTSDKLLIKTIPQKDTLRLKNILSLLFGSPKADTLPNTFLYQINDKGLPMDSAIILLVNDAISTIRR
ncbi:MAG: hypothetical protein ACXWWD_12790 [Chitinophagaceae bacterium]